SVVWLYRRIGLASPRPACGPSLTVTTTTRDSVRSPREIRNTFLSGQTSSRASICTYLKNAAAQECKVTLDIYRTRRDIGSCGRLGSQVSGTSALRRDKRSAPSEHLARGA